MEPLGLDQQLWSKAAFHVDKYGYSLSFRILTRHELGRAPLAIFFFRARPN